MAIAGVSMAFSAVCFVLVLGFTPAILPAAVLGIVGAVAAFASGGRRTALVTAIFGLVPFAEILIAAEVDSGYFVFVPAGVAIAIAAWAFADYLRARASRGAP
jgi:hypothetical protein